MMWAWQSRPPLQTCLCFDCTSLLIFCHQSTKIITAVEPPGDQLNLPLPPGCQPLAPVLYSHYLVISSIEKAGKMGK
jgi:hypothetical protein